ncbi:peroxiredoxin family protein [Colwellia psychrerythraea]|uniref:Alkyl hydroperoxide reductase/ Thiol specific antioxidant/ Mal allergen n=1 Tax=Colwellia psychrerythraea TaxID=28229 RepID=A0A099L383_COLPS|nr:peroxiredoxin family protein [Colwellia psychrerythraea]KGJ97424.1 alkyl hydroperoxide reductase/ Thiol specific antioxidant/ Mal allergen [Colwellia psychrerythraea]
MNIRTELTFHRKAVISLLLSLLFLTNSAIANTISNVGPTLNQKAPIISVLNTQLKAVNISQLSGKQGLIILFFRSADWCPFCKKHLIELNNQAEDFTKLGYGLAGISYDNTDILKKFARQQNISFPLLSDQNVRTMSAYNILNKEYSLGDDNYGIPYPGVVVIDNQGKVIHKHFFKGYKKRVRFSDLYLQLKNVDK